MDRSPRVYRQLLALYRTEITVDEKKAMDLFESGEAVGVYTTVLIMRVGGKTYISFDGRLWEETECTLIDKQL